MCPRGYGENESSQGISLNLGSCSLLQLMHRLPNMSCFLCEGFRAINLGDIGIVVVKDVDKVFQSPAQQHGFNFTYQLESGIIATYLARVRWLMPLL